jgi:hypothetical protein
LIVETWLLEDAAESASIGRSRAWLVSDRRSDTTLLRGIGE